MEVCVQALMFDNQLNEQTERDNATLPSPRTRPH